MSLDNYLYQRKLDHFKTIEEDVTDELIDDGEFVGVLIQEDNDEISLACEAVYFSLRRDLEELPSSVRSHFDKLDKLIQESAKQEARKRFNESFE